MFLPILIKHLLYNLLWVLPEQKVLLHLRRFYLAKAFITIIDYENMRSNPFSLQGNIQFSPLLNYMARKTYFTYIYMPVLYFYKYPIVYCMQYSSCCKWVLNEIVCQMLTSGKIPVKSSDTMQPVKTGLVYF